MPNEERGRGRSAHQGIKHCVSLQHARSVKRHRPRVLHSSTFLVAGFMPVHAAAFAAAIILPSRVSRLLTELLMSSTILVMQRNRRLQTLQRMRRPEPIEQSRLSPTCAPTRRRHPLTVQADSSSFVSYLQLFVSTPSMFCCVQRSIPSDDFSLPVTLARSLMRALD